MSGPLVGDRVPVDVGQVAHGGHCVARLDGLVVFVRHALPGERVLAEITEVRRAYLRADAVQVHTASPDRATPPCPHARPGGCGGCDLQHVSVDGQRRWKAAVVREQLQRLGGLTGAEVRALEVEVAALPGGPLGWRSRVRYSVDPAGRVGLLEHRSHRVVPVERCLIAAPAIQRAPVTDRTWPDAEAVEAVAGGGDVTVRALRAKVATRVQGPAQVREQAAGREWTLPPGVFWQAHPEAADTLARAVVGLLAPLPGDRVWDLYAGAGLFGAALAGPVGAAGMVTLVEASSAAVAAARQNLADLPWVRAVRSSVDVALRQRRLAGPVDLVVLDPPRSGAGAAVVRALVDAGPRAVAYVTCDPAAFARDVESFRSAGWSLVALRAYDCFPMTHHVECVGLLAPGPGLDAR